MANQVKIRRKQLGLTQEKVANHIGTTKATVMKLEKGMMQLTESWLQRLSVPLECRPEELIAEAVPEGVPVIGRIDAQGRCQLEADLATETGLREPDSGKLKGLKHTARPADGGAYRHLYALEVAGEAFAPFMASGSCLYYADPVHENFDDFIGQLVVCAEEGGNLQFGRLHSGDGFGAFTLQLLNGQKPLDVSPQWVAKIVYIKP